MNVPHAQPLRDDPTELDLKIFDVLREADQSARLLAQTLSQSDEQVGVDDVWLRFVGSRISWAGTPFWKGLTPG
jgi:hypothetical protein